MSHFMFFPNCWELARWTLVFLIRTACKGDADFRKTYICVWIYIPCVWQFHELLVSCCFIWGRFWHHFSVCFDVMSHPLCLQRGTRVVQFVAPPHMAFFYDFPIRFRAKLAQSIIRLGTKRATFIILLVHFPILQSELSSDPPFWRPQAAALSILVF